MAERITDEDLDLLGELGADTAPVKKSATTPREQRIVAGFEEIERFVEEHGRLPAHGEDREIFERLYAVRLDRLRDSEECRQVLDGRDPRGLLDAETRAEMDSDEALLAALGEGEGADITRLEHVRSREEIRSADEVAQRNPCKDFGHFRPLFDRVQDELASGERKTVKFQDNAEVRQGDFFVLDGQKVYVAALGDEFVNDYGRPDRRLRVIYDNGTESDLLLRSLQRALNKDKASRRITDTGFGPLFAEDEEDEEETTGHVYVLRSASDHRFIVENRSVIHKIGVTTGEVEKRVANASKDPTYLLAEVEIVATFKLSRIKPKGIEKLIHRFFGGARLDLALRDRFGHAVQPREWFLVPLPVIEEAMELLASEAIAEHRYDPKAGKIVKR